MTIMHTSPLAKSLEQDQRIALEEAIRKLHCPDIDYPEWEEIELNIVKNRDIIQFGLEELVPKALGKYVNRIETDIDVLKTLEGKFTGIIDKLDLKELRKQFENNKSESSVTFLDYIDQIEKLKMERDKERK